MPRLLREAGLRLVTLAEHYGVPADERVADEDGFALVGSRTREAVEAALHWHYTDAVVPLRLRYEAVRRP